MERGTISNVFESLFELLFKYRPLLFEEGDFAFRASWAGYLALVAAAVAASITRIGDA